MRKNQRPRWARKLRASDWKHLQEAQGRKDPTLRDLRLDAQQHGGCRECGWILTRVLASQPVKGDKLFVR